MILKSDINKVESSGITESKDIVIKQSHHIIEFATSRIYDNIIRAVIRELSTNAADSHVEAGNPEEKFVVTLPTVECPEFSVRDFGVGMSHETVMNLFSTLFESSKNNSNDFNGCFGIGSKAPIAYSPMYTVIAYDGNDTKRVYAVIKDDNVLKCNFIDEFEAPGERRGLEVIVPVKREDISKFHTEACRNVYPFFEVKPSMNDVWGIQEVLYSFQDFKEVGLAFSNHEPFSSMFVAVMGNTAYPLDMDVLKQNGIIAPENTVYGRKGTVLLYFDIGELAINPGRERLNYSVSNGTIEALRKKFEAVRIYIEEFFAEKLKSDSVFDATWKFNKYWKDSVFYKAYTWITSDKTKINYFILGHNHICYDDSRRFLPAYLKVEDLAVLSIKKADDPPFYDSTTGKLISRVNILPELTFIQMSAEWRDNLRKAKRIVNAYFNDDSLTNSKHTKVYYVYSEHCAEFCRKYNINPARVYDLDELAESVKSEPRRPAERKSKDADTFSAFSIPYISRITRQFSTYSEHLPLVFFVRTPGANNILVGDTYYEYVPSTEFVDFMRTAFGITSRTYEVLLVSPTVAAKLRKMPHVIDGSDQLQDALRRHPQFQRWIRSSAFSYVPGYVECLMRDKAVSNIESSKLKHTLNKLATLQPNNPRIPSTLFSKLFDAEIRACGNRVSKQIQRRHKKFKASINPLPYPVKAAIEAMTSCYNDTGVMARMLVSLYLRLHKDKIQKTKAQRREEYEKIIQAKKANSLLNGTCQLEVSKTGSAYSEKEHQAVKV